MGCNKLLDKQKMKKGLWSPDEDNKLRNHILMHGFTCWSSVPINAGLQRSGKSCRLRWINYLRAGLKRGMFNCDEENAVFALHQLLGNKWSQIAKHLPGRTDNEIKNYWHSYLKKRIMNESKNHELIRESESSQLSSVMSNIPKTSSFESFGNINGSSACTDQSIKKSSLPKVIFAEWLSLDQFHGQNLDLKNSQENRSSSYDQESKFEDDLNNYFSCEFFNVNYEDMYI